MSRRHHTPAPPSNPVEGEDPVEQTPIATVPADGTEGNEPEIPGTGDEQGKPKRLRAGRGQVPASTENGEPLEPVQAQPPAAPLVRKFRVSVPKDKCLPVLEVDAVTAADAKDVYQRELGIIHLGHPASVVQLG